MRIMYARWKWNELLSAETKPHAESLPEAKRIVFLPCHSVPHPHLA